MAGQRAADDVRCAPAPAPAPAATSSSSMYRGCSPCCGLYTVSAHGALTCRSCHATLCSKEDALRQLRLQRFGAAELAEVPPAAGEREPSPVYERAPPDAGGNAMVDGDDSDYRSVEAIQGTCPDMCPRERRPGVSWRHSLAA
eukprot:SM000234S07914  [mRNA]  locus=s234:94528:94956:- [translate_table: standard]